MRGLTLRQRQVLTLAAFGNTNEQIGRMLDVHANTIQHHLTAIYAALGARDRANAVAVAIHRGDISLGELGRIADAAAARLVERRQEATDGSVDARESARAARDVRGDAEAPQAACTASGERAA